MPTEHRRGGFVLMEAVIALALIGTVAVALLGATAMQVRSAERAARLLDAQALAEERLAVARALAWQDLTRPPDSLEHGRFPAPYEAYEWRMRIDAVEDEYELYRIAVDVTNGEHGFSVETYVHEPQPQPGSR